MTKQTRIGEVLYYPAANVEKLARVSRQTLWRWRQEGKIPAGHRFRSRQILFTAPEVEAIVAYANRVEPGLEQNKIQLGLFTSVGKNALVPNGT